MFTPAIHKSCLPVSEWSSETRKQAAALIGVHRKTIGHWLATYASEGLDALLDRDYSPGRPPRLSKEQQELLRAELEKPEGFSSYQQITDYISETFDVQRTIKLFTIRYKWRPNKVKVIQKACYASLQLRDKLIT